MTGPEHYREAERLISMVEKALPGGQFRHFDGDEDTRAMLAAAQVHATLALAAATAYPAIRAYSSGECRSVDRAWAAL